MRLIPIVMAFFSAISVSSLAEAQPAASQAGCSLTAMPAAEHQLMSGGKARVYRLFVPDGFSSRSRLPLVLDLHPSGGTAAGQAKTSGFETLAAREGFVVASLQAIDGRWNVPVADGRADDVAYVSDVIDQVSSRVCIDVSRVYAAGFSGGGRMSSLLACRLSSRITAIAPMSALRWPGSCDGRPVPVLAFHGLADTQNPYAGHAEGRGAEWVESVPEALAGWATHNRCKAAVIEEDPPGPLSTMRYDGCDQQAEVRLIRIDGLGHTWVRTEIDATTTMWEFFKRHTLLR